MRHGFALGVLALLIRLSGYSQEVPIAQSSLLMTPAAHEPQQSVAGIWTKVPVIEAISAGSDSPAATTDETASATCFAGKKFRYYMAETYWNPSLLTAPAFTASFRMANPPGKGASRYPDEWRQGAEGFGRNYGDAFAMRIGTHTAQFVTGLVTHEAPWYTPSTSRGFFARSAHALAFTFIDRSDSGRRLPAFSNFAGAAAGGLVGNAYLPDGFRDATHAGQRATMQFGMLGAGNLFREFAPQMPGSMRAIISLIAR